MGKYLRQVPDGVEDCLPEECCIKRNIESALRAAFIASGFDEMETPTYEFYDAFQSGVGAYLQESMIKFMDAKGRILVLRPDITVPIARAAATRMDLKSAKRLFYIQNSFAAAQPAVGRAGEFTQAGVELIGDERCSADAEIIALAIKSLKVCGLKSFTADIGQVAYFKALIAGMGLEEAQADTLRHAVDSKDLMAVEAAADALKLGKEAKAQIMALPSLFGGCEVFDKAISLTGNRDCAAAVENLRSVYGLLCEYGLGNYISVDFGMLHDIAYYSGIIFRGITPGIGFPVVSGGRYDELLSKFGRPAPATGFALGIKRVMIAMERQGLLGGYYDTAAVVSGDGQSCGKAYAYAEALRAEGKRVIFSAGSDAEALLALKKKNGAEAAVYFKADGGMLTL
jgi:ATP phosphoribosyltransferase, regulatory subunit